VEEHGEGAGLAQALAIRGGRIHSGETRSTMRVAICMAPRECAYAMRGAGERELRKADCLMWPETLDGRESMSLISAGVTSMGRGGC